MTIFKKEFKKIIFFYGLLQYTTIMMELSNVFPVNFQGSWLNLPIRPRLHFFHLFETYTDYKQITIVLDFLQTTRNEDKNCIRHVANPIVGESHNLILK